MKSRGVGAELCRADGQTDKTKLGVAFRNVSNAPLSNVVPEGTGVTGVIAPLILNSALGRQPGERADGNNRIRGWPEPGADRAVLLPAVVLQPTVQSPVI